MWTTLYFLFNYQFSSVGSANVAAAVTELGWIAPPVSVSTGTNASVSLAPVELAWIAPPVSASGSASVSPLPKELAWLTPPVTVSAAGGATVNLAPVAMGWIAPPVTVSASASVTANVVALAFHQVGAQASALITQAFVYPCGLAFAKVSPGFVGQIPTPSIIFTGLPGR